MYRLIGDNHSLGGLPYSAQVFLRALDNVRRELARRAGVSGGELSVLARIAEESEITVATLAQQLELSDSTAAELIVTLASRDLLVVSSMPATGAATLDLTPTGHSLMEKVYLDFQESINGAATSLDDERLYAFDSSMLKMARKLDAASVPSPAE